MRSIIIAILFLWFLMLCGCQTAQDRHQAGAVNAAGEFATADYDAKLARANEAKANSQAERDDWKAKAEVAERKAADAEGKRKEETRQAREAAQLAEETTDRHLCFIIGLLSAIGGAMICYFGFRLSLIGDRLQILAGALGIVSAICFTIMPLIGNHWVAPAIVGGGILILAAVWIAHHATQLHTLAVSVATRAEIDAEDLIPKARTLWARLLDHLHAHGTEIPVNDRPGTLTAINGTLAAPASPAAKTA
jgi:hypothetical protein